MSNPTITRKPDAVAKAERDVRKAELSVSEAKAELISAESAYAGAAEADALAFEQAEAAGKAEPTKLPSVVLKTGLDVATARLTARRTMLSRAEARLADTFRAEGPAWHAAELAVAEQDEADCLAKLDDLIAAFDRAKASRALAGWVATTRAGTPQPLTRINGVTGPGGESVLRDLVERQLGVTQRRMTATVQGAGQKAADAYVASDAAAAAEAEQRQARHDEQQLAEQRSQQRYLDNLAKLAEVG